jgi:AAA domain
MGSLLVVSGPPGAGKSTVARAVADRQERSVLVAGDAFFGFLHRGAIEPWLPESNDQNTVVIRAAAASAGAYAAGGFDTVYDGVVGPWFLPQFVAATGLGRLDFVILMPSLDRCLERVATRRGHGFTDQCATARMHRDFAGAPVDERYVLADPPGGPDAPDQIAERILAMAAGGKLAYEP